MPKHSKAVAAGAPWLLCALQALAAESPLAQDSAGRPTRVGEPAAQVQLAYDAAGRLQRVDEPGGRTTRLSYDPAGRLQAVTGADGLDERFSYDAQGLVAGMTCGGRTCLTLSYDAAGRPAEFGDPQGPRRRLAYDALGRITSVSDALGRSTRFGYDTQGRLILQTAPNGAKTGFQYDAQGRLATVNPPEGGQVGYRYDAQGRLLKISGPGDADTAYEYAPEGGLAAIVGPGGARTTRSMDRASRSLVFADSLGKTSRVLNAQGLVTALTDRHGLRETFDYDPQGRLTRHALPDGRVERLGYDVAGRIRTAADGFGSQRSYDYDSRGRLQRIAEDGQTITEFRHGKGDQVIAQSDALGRETRFGHDAAERLVSAVGPTGASATLARDAEGRVTRLVTPEGSATQFVYGQDELPVEIKTGRGVIQQKADAAGRLVSRTDATGRTVRYGWDLRDRLLWVEADQERSELTHAADGRLLSVKDSKGTQTFSHDSHGRLTAVDTPGVGKVQYSFNPAGELEGVTAPSGAQLLWRYDSLHRPASVSLPYQGGEIRFSWATGGRLAGVVLPNKVQATLATDAALRPKSLSWLAADGKPLLTWALSYDATGMPLTADTPGQGAGAAERLAFEYDGEGRLVGERRGARQVSYRYAPNGDRVLRRDGHLQEDYRYDGGLLSQAGDTRFVHDADGRITRQVQPGGARVHGWDALGRLVHVAFEPGGGIGLSYDSFGQLIGVTRANGKTTLAHDRGQLLEERAPGGDTTLYVHAPGIDRPLAMHRGGQWFYFLGDWQGSVAALTDASGHVVARYERDAFGRELNSNSLAMDSRLAFHGRPCFSEFGLCWFRQRWYDPQLGRFLSADPLFGDPADPQSLNRYAMARNAPTRYRDPMGVAPWDWQVDYRLEAKRTGLPESVLRQLTRELFQLTETNPNFRPGARTSAMSANALVKLQADWVWHARNGTYAAPMPLTAQEALNTMRANLGLPPHSLAPPGGGGGGGGSPQITVNAPLAPRPPSHTPAAGTATPTGGVPVPVDPNIVDLAAVTGPQPSSGQIAAGMLESPEPPLPMAEPVPRVPTQLMNPQTPAPARLTPMTLRDLAPTPEAPPTGPTTGRPRSAAAGLATGVGVAGVLGGVTAAADCYARGGDAQACAQAGAAGAGLGLGVGALGIAVVETIRAGVVWALGAGAGTAFAGAAAVAGTGMGVHAAATAAAGAGNRALYGTPQEQRASAAGLAALDQPIAEMNELSNAGVQSLKPAFTKAQELDAAMAGVRERQASSAPRRQACAAAATSVAALAKMADAVADPALDATQRLRDGEPPADATNDTRIAVEVVRHAVREANGLAQLASLAATALRDASPGTAGAGGQGGGARAAASSDADRKLALAYNDAMERLSEAADATQQLKNRFDAAKKAALAQVAALPAAVRSQDLAAFERRVALIEAARFEAADDLAEARQQVRSAGNVLAATVKSAEQQAAAQDKAQDPCAALATAEQVAQQAAKARAAVARIDTAFVQVAAAVAARGRKIDEAKQANDKILQGAPGLLADAKASGDKALAQRAEFYLKNANDRQARVIKPQQIQMGEAKTAVQGAQAAAKAAATALAKASP